MRTTLFSAFLCTLVISATAQVQQDWAKKFVGSGPDNPAALAADKLGNIWMCGNNNWGYNTADMYTLRYNSSGTQTAGFLYNSPYNSADNAKAITTDPANNVYVVGKASIGSSTSDVVIIKYNSSAVQQWVTLFNTPQNYLDDANAVATDAAGNVYITGSVVKTEAFEYDYLTAKFNTAGVLQWYALYNGTANGVDIANDIAVDASGNVYVTGLSAGAITNRLGTFATGYDYVTIKYDANGNQLWVQRYNNVGGNDEAKAIALDGSGNVYVTGVSSATSSGSSNSDCATIKYDNNGVQQWLQRYAGSSGVNDAGVDLAVDGSANVYVAGYANSSSSGCSVLALKYNTGGALQFASLYSGTSGSSNIGRKMGLDAYASMYIVAQTSAPGLSSDFLTLKYTTNGVLGWAIKYNSPENAYEYPTDVKVVMPNAPIGSAVNALVYVTGQSNNDAITVKYSQPTVVCCAFTAGKGVAEELPLDNFNVSNYPNPAKTHTNIQYQLPSDAQVTIDVYDVLGRKVTTLVNGFRKAGTYIAKLNSAGLSNGVYHYQCTIQAGEQTFRQTKAFVIEK